MTGVSIIDMSIEDVVITNPELAKAMSQAAVSATKLDSARIEVEERRMRAQGEARSMQILATVSERREERNNIEISFVTLYCTNITVHPLPLPLLRLPIHQWLLLLRLLLIYDVSFYLILLRY